jgi:predicted aminopeptidase
MKQGYYVIKYTTSSTPIEKLQRRVGTPEDLKRFFSLVHDIREFAFDSVGLKKNNNFTTYVKVDRKYLVDIVFAAGKDNFTPYQWRFPFFGSFPDKGYFDRRDAEAEALRLDKKGYDTYIGRGDAFSTLGFFSDPIYSFMKDFSLFEIASLIIHEETHATLFIKDQVQFNEEMATFFGTEGALRFIKAKFGDTSEQFKNAEKQSRDYQTYVSLIDSLYLRLKAVYEDKISAQDKLQKKNEIIDLFKNFVTDKYYSLFSTPNYQGLKKVAINNAFISADITYAFDLKDFYALYQKDNKSFRTMLSSLKVLNNSKVDPHEVMRKL